VFSRCVDGIAQEGPGGQQCPGVGGLGVDTIPPKCACSLAGVGLPMSEFSEVSAVDTTGQTATADDAGSDVGSVPYRNEALQRVSWLNAEGFLHRVGLPAVEHFDGGVEFWEHGRRHRVGEPAIVRADGSTEWWLEGRTHREGGLPAIEDADGGKEWFENGERHRLGGPARVFADGSWERWEYGELVEERYLWRDLCS